MTRLKAEIRVGNFAQRALQQRARLWEDWNRHSDGHGIFNGNFEQFITIMRPRRPSWKPDENRLQ